MGAKTTSVIEISTNVRLHAAAGTADRHRLAPANAADSLKPAAAASASLAGAAPDAAPSPVPLPRPTPPAWLRAAFRAAATLLPPLAVRWAEHAFVHPPRARAKSSAVLASGHRFFLRAGAEQIAVWSWGDGPTALLLHGWGGRSEQLAPFVQPLLAAGFSVVAPDAPGHGESSGRECSVLAFADALQAVADRVRPVDVFLGHSGGAAAGALAIHRGLRVRRAVFISPVASLEEVAARFARQLNIAPWTAEAMRRRLESRFGVPMADLEVTKIARNADVPLLVFHDPDDPEVPWRDGASIAQAWPGARLVDVPRAGHNRILRDQRVVAEAVSFLASGRR